MHCEYIAEAPFIGFDNFDLQLFLCDFRDVVENEFLFQVCIGNSDEAVIFPTTFGMRKAPGRWCLENDPYICGVTGPTLYL